MTAHPPDGGSADRPPWIDRIAGLVGRVRAEDLSRFLPPEHGGRPSAVLLLFSEGDRGPEVVLLQRGTTLRDHPGQVAFPGGAVDAADGSPVATALREAEEEIGVPAEAVDVLGALPSIFLPASGYVVTPVLGWDAARSPLSVCDPVEVAAVHRVPLAELADPANRFRVRHPNGWYGPAFEVRPLTVWGFTGGLLDRVLCLAGWEQPWDRDRVEPVPVPPGADLLSAPYAGTTE